ncbi:hypothetical protein [Psychrobacter frigidicola]|uniref:hypothetical protein n=1 Tax=Psychrobacter frigidicola TaxID=45611 RepID=UPI0019198174|nr:hypothetical protein [Psychrobacter frigidicola]
MPCNGLFDRPLSFIQQPSLRLQVEGQPLFNNSTPDYFLQIDALTGQGLEYLTIADG